MKLSRSDALVSTGVLLGVIGLLWLFFIDIGSFTLRGNIQPLGTVVFKRLSATRRPSNALGWEGVRNNSPVYNADTLRTGGLSEAAIFFDDGTSLELGANSMLRLDFGGPERNLEFLDGEITVGGSASGSSYVISSLAGTITVGADSSATFSRDSEQNVVGVEVNRGFATLTRMDGTTETVRENQSLEVSVVDGTSSFVSRPIVPVSPERNARVLIVSDVNVRGSDSRLRGNELAETAYPFEFSWLLEGAAASGGTAVTGARDGAVAGADNSSGTAVPGGELSSTSTAPRFTLELSSSKNFTGNTLEYAVIGLRSTVPVVPGAWYWRVRDEAGLLSSARKFSVDVGTFPRPAFPDDGTRYRYRRKAPEIRFAWTAMKEATAYVFELSNSAGFENTKMRTRVAGSNFSVSDIGEGTWYWRVTPVHGYSEVQGAGIAAVRSFIIEKSGAMSELAVSTPFAGHLYQIQEIAEKGLAFAWIPHVEAISYELVVSDTEDFSNSLLVEPSIVPYTRVSGLAAGILAQAGTRFWGVRWIDTEGNRSPVSGVRKIVGIDGSIAMRSIFPPNGYRIADSLASNTRFTWRSNVAAPTVFFLARDSAFREIVYQEQVMSETLIGKSWESGIWYWKIRTLNADNSVFMETQVRSFSIIDPLPGPIVLSPIPEKIFYLREGDSLSLEWNQISGADYYSVSVFASDLAGETTSTPLFEQSHLESTQIKIPLGFFQSGRYLVQVQGFTLETKDSTQIIGYIGNSYLQYQQLEYIQLLSPANEVVFEGLEAKRKGVPLRYKTRTKPEVAEFQLLKRESDGLHEITKESVRSDSFVAKKLQAGSYFWRVQGKLADFDISSRDTWSFTVLPVPPLPPVVIILPIEGMVFGAKELRTNRNIEFSWLPVPDSNRYRLSIYPEAIVPRPSYIFENITENSFILTDLSVLSRGNNTIQVEALYIEETGEIERSGIPVKRTITIDIPPAKPVQSQTGSTLYGR